MSTELNHEEARAGNCVLHDNGSVFWNTVHHVSWLDDDRKRVYAPNFTSMLSETEQADARTLAARHDEKGIK